MSFHEYEDKRFKAMSAWTDGIPREKTMEDVSHAVATVVKNFPEKTMVKIDSMQNE